MKFKGEPNQLVRLTKIPKSIIRKVPKHFRFDKDGIYETENTYLIKRLKTKFEEIIEEIEEIEEIKVNYNDLDYKELQTLYVEKTGNSAIGIKKTEIIKELEG